MASSNITRKSTEQSGKSDNGNGRKGITITWSGIMTVVNLLKIPGIVIGAFATIWLILQTLGFTLVTPEQSRTDWRTSQVQLHTKIDSLLGDLEGKFSSHDALIKALVIGECLDNPREKIIRAGLLETCRNLGIEPQ